MIIQHFFILLFSCFTASAMDLAKLISLKDEHEKQRCITDLKQFDLKFYARPDQAAIYEQAREQLAYNKDDHDALKALKAQIKAKAPYAPAYRALASRALHNDSVNAAFNYLHAGANMGDPSCQQSLATLYGNSDKVPSLANQDREEVLQQGMQIALAAATPRVFVPTPEEKDSCSVYFFQPQAMDLYTKLWNNYTAEKEKKEYKRCLAAFEKERLEKPSLPGYCDLINFYAHGDEHLNLKKDSGRVFELLKKAIEHEDFAKQGGVAGLRISGAYKAVSDMLKGETDASVTCCVHYLLGLVGLEELKTNPAGDKQEVYLRFLLASQKEPRALAQLAGLTDATDEKISHAKQCIQALDALPIEERKSLAQQMAAALEPIVMRDGAVAVPPLLKLYSAAGITESKKLKDALDAAARHNSYSTFVELLKNDSFEYAKATLLSHATSDELYQVGQSILDARKDTLGNKTVKKNNQKIKESACVFLRAAVEKGSVPAAWQLIVHGASEALARKSLLDFLTVHLQDENNGPVQEEIRQAVAQLEKEKGHGEFLLQVYCNGIKGALAANSDKAKEYARKVISCQDAQADVFVRCVGFMKACAGKTDARSKLMFEEAGLMLRNEANDGNVAAIEQLLNMYKECKENAVGSRLQKFLISVMAQHEGFMDEAYDIFKDYCKHSLLDEEGRNAIYGGLTSLIRKRYMPAVHWLEELRQQEQDQTLPPIEHTVESLELLWKQTRGKTTAFSKRCSEYAISQIQVLLLEQQRIKAQDMRHLADMYRAVQVLGASNNDVEAVHWLFEAQRVVRFLAPEIPDSVDLFQKIGLENFIDAMIEQGFGWAYYARALILHSLYAMPVERTPEAAIKALIPVSNALEKSQSAKVPFLPAMKYLDICTIDRLIAGSYVSLRNYSKATEYLARGASKNDVASCFELGCLYLRGFTSSRGQQALDIGLSYLERAAEQGMPHAVQTLAKFLTNTQEYADKLHQCGGVIPPAMHARMYTQLKEFMQKDSLRWKPELEIFEKYEQKKLANAPVPGSFQLTPPVLPTPPEETLENRLAVLNYAIENLKAHSSSRNAINTMLGALDDVQSAAGKEKSPEARACVYSSGAGKEIETYLKGSQDVPLLVAVMTNYLSFANKYGLPSKEHQGSFWAPFLEFERVASHSSFNERGVNRVVHGIKEDAYARLIDQLAIAKNKTGDARFERAYASAHILGVASDQKNCSFKSAIECLHKSQNKSDAQICYLLSVLHSFGHSVDRKISKNIALAEQYLKQAADRGHSGACVALGIRLLMKTKKSRKDILEAEKYFKNALEVDGNSEARFHLAQIYFKNPELVEYDHKKIYEFFTKAAQQSPSLYPVATIYSVCLALNYPQKIARPQKDIFTDLSALFVNCLHEKSYDSLIGAMNEVGFTAVLTNFFENLTQKNTEGIDGESIHYLSALCSFVMAKAETDRIKQRQYIVRGITLMEQSGQYGQQTQALTVMADVFSEGLIKDYTKALKYIALAFTAMHSSPCPQEDLNRFNMFLTRFTVQLKDARRNDLVEQLVRMQHQASAVRTTDFARGGSSVPSSKDYFMQASVKDVSDAIDTLIAESKEPAKAIAAIEALEQLCIDDEVAAFVTPKQRDKIVARIKEQVKHDSTFVRAIKDGINAQNKEDDSQDDLLGQFVVCAQPVLVKNVLCTAFNLYDCQHYKKAVVLFKALAETGNAYAQLFLSALYFDGVHVTQSYHLSDHYLNMFLRSGSRDFVLSKLAGEQLTNLEKAPGTSIKIEEFPASWQELNMSDLRYFQQHRLSEELVSVSESNPARDTHEAFAIMRRNIRAYMRDKSLSKIVVESGLPKRIGTIINREGYSDAQAIEALLIQAAYCKMLGECENKDYGAAIEQCIAQALTRNSYITHSMLAFEYMQGDLFEKNIKKATTSFCNALKALSNGSLTPDEFTKHQLFTLSFKERLRSEESADSKLMLSIIATTEQTLTSQKLSFTIAQP